MGAYGSQRTCVKKRTGAVAIGDANGTCPRHQKVSIVLEFAGPRNACRNISGLNDEATSVYELWLPHSDAVHQASSMTFCGNQRNQAIIAYG